MYARSHEIVQRKNPVTGRYIKIDRTVGEILGRKKSPGPYKGIPVARRKRRASARNGQ